MNTTDMQIIIQPYHKQLYATKLEHQVEVELGNKAVITFAHWTETEKSQIDQEEIAVESVLRMLPK